MSECVISHGVDAEGKPRRAEATRGLLCGNHAHRLAEWLHDIAIDYALLATRLTPAVTNPAFDPQRHGDGADPAAPLDLAVAALRDSERAGSPRPRGDELWYEDPDIPSVLATVHTIAEDVRCLLDPSREHDPDVKDRHVVTEVTYLLDAFDTLCTAPFVDEAFAEIKGVWIALQRAHNRPRPRPLGPCLNVDCGGTVWPRQDAAPWCSTCRRVYDRDPDLVKIAIEAEKQQRRKARP